MWYEINVSLNGEHLFATHERSITDGCSLVRCLEIFLEKFPESEGYEIMVSKWKTAGEQISIKKVLKQTEPVSTLFN